MSKRSNDEDDGTTSVSVPKVPATTPAPEKSGYLMVVSSGAQLTGRMFKLSQPQMVLGRSSGTDIRILDDGVSRKHAKFTVIGPGRIRLTDLKSRNGTYVNGERIDEIELNDGDRVQIGSTAVLLFSLQDELEEQFTRRLYESATHDGLTGLFNKTYLTDTLKKELSFAQRYKSPFSMLMIDVDHFKLLNDTHGHPAGDVALAQIAQRLGQLTRNEDVVARYGGEEFAALLKRADLPAAKTCAERYRAAIEGLKLTIGPHLLSATISIGVVTLDGGVKATAAAVVAQADARLYEAKNSGRNRVVAGAYIP